MAACAINKMINQMDCEDIIIIDLADEPAGEAAGGEPEEAADLGMPFIEPDPTHDSPKAVADEWEGWVNWSTVGA